MNETTKNERLFSLDLLRGLDIFLLTVVGVLVRAANEVWRLPDAVMAQFEHPWGGFTMWDLIMPLFIFMCGAAMPFALGRRLRNGRPTAAFWRHVAWRMVLLWVLGMVSQGNLLTFDPMKISPYNNTLQTIAMGYLITALAMCVPCTWFRRLLPIGLALIYTLLLAFGGDYTAEGNFAMKFEVKALSFFVPDGSGAYNLWRYTWFLTSLMFGAMALCGFHATELLRSSLAPWRKCGLLALGGAAMLALGWGLTPVVPMIKQIFTVSFTLAAMGWSCLLLAALYALTDIWKIRRGLGLFILFGQFALWAYMSGYFRDTAILSFSQEVLGGLSRWLGSEPMPFVYAVSNGLFVIVLLLVRRRCGRRNEPAEGPRKRDSNFR